jgi:hypothetical protein
MSDLKKELKIAELKKEQEMKRELRLERKGPSLGIKM